MRVEEIMNTEVVTVPPEMPLRDVAALLVEHRFSGLPVCDEAGAVVGVVSEADIVRRERGRPERPGLLVRMLEPSVARDDERALARTAGEAMTSPPITIARFRSVSEAARLMTEHGINRLPVLDASDNLVGIVSRADLVRAFARPDDEIAHDIRKSVVQRSMWIEPGTVTVSVDGGEVALKGVVDRRTEAETLVLLTERVPGVVSVQSDVTYREDDTRRSR